MPVERQNFFCDVIDGQYYKFVQHQQGSSYNQKKNDGIHVQLPQEFDNIFKQIHTYEYKFYNYYTQHIKLGPEYGNGVNIELSFLTFNNILYEMSATSVYNLGHIIEYNQNDKKDQDSCLYSPFQLCSVNNKLYYLSIVQNILYEIKLDYDYVYTKRFRVKRVMSLLSKHQIIGIVPMNNKLFFLSKKAIYQLDSFNKVIMVYSLEYNDVKKGKQTKKQSGNGNSEKNKQEYYQLWAMMKNILVYYSKIGIHLITMHYNRLSCITTYDPVIVDYNQQSTKDYLSYTRFSYQPTLQTFTPAHDKCHTIFTITRTELQQLYQQNQYQNIRCKYILLQILYDLFIQLRAECDNHGVTQAVINQFKVQQLNDKLANAHKRMELCRSNKQQSEHTNNFANQRLVVQKSRFTLSNSGSAGPRETGNIASARNGGAEIASGGVSPRGQAPHARSASAEPSRSPSVFVQRGLRLETLVYRIVNAGIELSHPSERTHLESTLKRHGPLLKRLLLLQMLFPDEVLDSMCHDFAAWNALLKGDFIVQNLEFYDIQLTQVHVALFYNVFYQNSDYERQLNNEIEDSRSPRFSATSETFSTSNCADLELNNFSDHHHSENQKDPSTVGTDPTKYLIFHLHLYELQILQLMEQGLLDNFTGDEYLKLLKSNGLQQVDIEETAYATLSFTLVLSFYMGRDLGLTEAFVTSLCQKKEFDIFETAYFNESRYRPLFAHGFHILKAMVASRISFSEKEELKQFLSVQWARLDDRERRELRNAAASAELNDPVFKQISEEAELKPV